VFANKRIEIFNKEKSEWNNLTQRILSNNYVSTHLGLTISPSDLDETISIELKERGIISFTVTKDLTCQEVEYLTNWTKYPIGTLYLTWNPCDSMQTKQGYYKDNSNFIEIWGVGNDWLIWIDSDSI